MDQGGKIIRNIFGTSYKEAETIQLRATKGNLDFTTPKEANFHGKDGGKKFGDYDAKEDAPLLVKKIEGPFDDKGEKVSIIEKGKQYSYKVTQFNRDPKTHELKTLRWALQFDDRSIVEKPNITGSKTAYITVNGELENLTKLTVYAFFRKASRNASVACDIQIIEVLLIVGTEQHSQTYGNKMMFPAQAVREIRQNYKNHKKSTIIIFTDGFNDLELSAIEKDAKKLNTLTNFKKINSVTQLINYINTGDGKRNKVKIGTIKIFSHGLPSILDFGLDGKNSESQRLRIQDVAKIKVDSFIKKAEIFSYACRTGNSDSRDIVSINTTYEYDKNWINTIKPEESLAQKLSNHLDAKVYAYLRRSNYTSTWLDNGDQTYKKKYITIEDEEVSNPLNPKDWFRKGWDDALWNPEGAYLPPTTGKTPLGLPAGMYLFEKNKEPRKK